MKYFPSQNRNYESNLTAKLMYNLVDSLIKKHATRGDIERLNNSNLGSRKLWTIPSIRSELEEFVIDYINKDARGHLNGFEEIFTPNSKNSLENFRKYMDKLMEQYDSKKEAKEAASLLLEESKKRSVRLYDEIQKIYQIKKGKDLIKTNTRDAFGHIGSICLLIDLVIMEFEKI